MARPVIAARAGIVQRVFDGSNQCYTGVDIEEARWYFPNIIEIKHHDGTVAHYQHLQKGSIRSLDLRTGDIVSQGDKIGATGPSGWIGLIPHLHFMVYNPTSDFMGKKVLQTRPVEFKNYEGPFYHEELKEIYGQNYPFTLAGV